MRQQSERNGGDSPVPFHERVTERAVPLFLDPCLMTAEETARILDRAEEMLDWIKRVKEYALQEALKGTVYPGWTIGESRTYRVFTNDAEVAKRVRMIGKNPFEKKLLSVADMEKMLGKKRFAEVLGDLTEKPKGRAVLVKDREDVR